MTAQIKLVSLKRKQTNKQNVNKVHRTIKSYNYYQLLTYELDYAIFATKTTLLDYIKFN